jgi:hypothetical protein
MKVSLWAEIRRLHEVERLSQAAIAWRLHCSHRTVRKALSMASPPTSTRETYESILDPYRARIDVLMDKYPDLSAVRVREEIAQGEEGYRGSVYPVRRYLRRIQWCGALRLSASRVLGPLRPLLPGTDCLRGPRPGIERDRRGGSALCQAQCPGGP